MMLVFGMPNIIKLEPGENPPLHFTGVCAEMLAKLQEYASSYPGYSKDFILRMEGMAFLTPQGTKQYWIKSNRIDHTDTISIIE